MDTTRTATKIFADQLSAVEMLFGMEPTSGTPGERIAQFGEQARGDKGLVASLREFFSNPVHFSKRFASSSDGIFESVVRTLFAVSVRGVIHSYGNMGAPKNQHWMPLAYLSSFGEATSESKNSRSVLVPGVSFADELVLGFETRDSSFIHDKVNGAGFYEDSAEYFFHLVEGLYAQGRNGRKSEIDHGLVALFFFVQSVRNPRYGQRFVHSALSSIIDAVLTNIDAVGPSMKVKFLQVPVDQKLPFTPYVPPFVDRIGGERVYSLPVNTHLLFSVSTGALKHSEWKTVPGRYRKAVVRQAQRRGSYVFGVHKGDIRGLLAPGTE